MATKEMERKALEEIRNIVEDLGKDSYIGMAMDGVFEDAEQNIENDWAMSWKERAETYNKKLEELAKIYDRDTYESSRKLELTQKELETAKHHMELEAERANALKEKLDTETKCCDLRRQEAYEKEQEIFNLKEQISFKDREIMELKAKLYDLMVK